MNTQASGRQRGGVRGIEKQGTGVVVMMVARDDEAALNKKLFARREGKQEALSVMI